MYADRVNKSCGCLPLKMITNNNNNTKMCQPKELECVKKVPNDDLTCLQGCQGSYVTDHSMIALTSSELSFLNEIETDYKAYKRERPLRFVDIKGTVLKL